MLRRAYRSIRAWALQNDNEERQLKCFLAHLGVDGSSRIADVGCGYGRILRLLRDAGLNAVGVEINPVIADKNKGQGFNCLLPDELRRGKDEFDVLVLFHLIEHFAFQDLKEFLDGYLDYLKPGGALIIATPLNSRSFYDDFDHVKPYHPHGVLAIFGGGDSQVRFYSRNKVELTDLWFRREPFEVKFVRSLYVPPYSKWPELVNVFFGILYKVSFGIIGKTNGWMGVFRKL
jgi:2-polyprenyl-3-methyl-5-hydroxy-6-metoxy-1,4-benzoquinol methylase